MQQIERVLYPSAQGVMEGSRMNTSRGRFRCDLEYSRITSFYF